MSYAEQEAMVPKLMNKIATLEAENAKLRTVVEAAEAYRVATIIGLSNMKQYGRLVDALAALEQEK